MWKLRVSYVIQYIINKFGVCGRNVKIESFLYYSILLHFLQLHFLFIWCIRCTLIKTLHLVVLMNLIHIFISNETLTSSFCESTTDKKMNEWYYNIYGAHARAENYFNKFTNKLVIFFTRIAKKSVFPYAISKEYLSKG